MSNNITVIKSLPVSNTTLTGSDVPENEYPTYSAGTTYALDAMVIDPVGHRIYRSLQNGNVGNPLVSPSAFWADQGPTNKWKCFDLSVSSQTTVGTSAYYEFTPNSAVNSVSLINIYGLSTVRIRLTDPVFGVVYDKTASLSGTISSSSWYAWFYEPRTARTVFVATDLPSYPTAILRVDITSNVSGKVGAIVYGYQQTLGESLRPGVRLGLQDFSRKERNTFGEVELVQRAFAKRISFNLHLDNRKLDTTYNFLSDIRSTPCLWILQSTKQSLIMFGFYNNFEITIPYRDHSDCSIDIESLI